MSAPLGRIEMSDPTQLTTHDLYFRDPEIYPPPKGVNMLLLNSGGVLIVGTWSDDCLAWCPKPKIPKSLKEKIRIKNVNTGTESD